MGTVASPAAGQLLAKQREVEQLKLEKAKGPAKAELAAIEHYEVLLKVCAGHTTAGRRCWGNRLRVSGIAERT